MYGCVGRYRRGNCTNKRTIKRAELELRTLAGIAEIYKRKVARLTETLDDPETRLDASSDIRSLVGRIVLQPGDKRGEVHAMLHGSLMGIIGFVNDNPKPEASRVATRVASGSLG